MIWPVTIHYGDGSTVECADRAAWDAAPAWHVIGVSWPDEDVNTDFAYGRSFYFIAPWKYNRPVSGDAGGLYDFLRETTGRTDRSVDAITPDELISLGVKFGRTISTQDYNEIIRPIVKRYKMTTRAWNLPERNLV